MVDLAGEEEVWLPLYNWPLLCLQLLLLSYGSSIGPVISMLEPHTDSVPQDEEVSARPSTACSYQGVETSLSTLQEVWLAEQPFDGILGPSRMHFR